MALAVLVADDRLVVLADEPGLSTNQDAQFFACTNTVLTDDFDVDFFFTRIN